ncbi:MAG: hypothetical protein PVH96_09110, partial [Gemmatimonadota bacterium]
MILPTRLAAMRLPVRTLIAALAVLAPAAAAAQAGSGIRADAVHVFLDCNTRRCDSEYFRTEISFVNWVRDRTLAEVHLIITSTETGGGGDVYDLEFIGLEEL